MLLALVAPMPALLAGGAGARPDHSITGLSSLDPGVEVTLPEFVATIKRATNGDIVDVLEAWEAAKVLD